MVLALFIAFLVGVICSDRMPVLVFTIISVVVVAGSILVSLGQGHAWTYSLGTACLVAVALQAGCAAMHYVLYRLYIKRQKDVLTRRSMAASRKAQRLRDHKL